MKQRGEFVVDSMANSMSLLPLISYSLSLGGADPTVSPRKGSSIPLVSVTQVCTHQNRAFPPAPGIGSGRGHQLRVHEFCFMVGDGAPSLLLDVMRMAVG